MFNNIFTPKNKKADRELFLAIEIHESLIKTAVWQVEDEKPSIVSLGSYELWDSEDSLINGTDASLTEATKGLDSQPDRVILGLPESWLVDNKVHPTKQKIIKRLKDDLSIKPIGVVTITEAVVRHLKDQEGIPPTATLLEIYPSKVIVTLVNVGEKQAIEEVGRSDDLARDVEEGLARFDAEKLPARFILTNGSDLSDEEQQIVSYPWTEKLPFIHIPKVQVLPIDFSIRAIALSGGAEAAKSLGIEISEEEQSPAKFVADAVIDAATGDFSSLGFKLEGEEEVPVETTPVIHNPFEEEIVTQTPTEEPAPLTGLLSRLPKLPPLNFSRPLLLSAPLILFALSVVSVTAYYFLQGRVKVTLAVSPLRRDQVIDVAIGTNPVADLLTVPAAKKTISAKASDSLSTTGEAVVGEKATGKVNIFNYTDQPISLKAGIKIIAGNLSFILDSAVSIASKSGTMAADGSFPPGNASASVTASKIGAESNLSKDTLFAIDTYPQGSLRARSESAFTGGTSRTVKAVSKDDQEKLLASVSQKIKAAIDDQLKKDDPDSRSLAVGPLKFSTKNFDHPVGEEATTLNLDLAANLEVLVYSRKQLLSQVEGKVLESANPGQVLAAEHTQVSLTDPVLGSADTFTTKANVSAILLPELSGEKLAKETKGKRVTVLKELLQTVPGFASATIEIYPNIPLLNSFLPANDKRFVFNVITE